MKLRRPALRFRHRGHAGPTVNRPPAVSRSASSRYHCRRRPQPPDIASIARAAGTPEIPGLKMVWLAPWGDVRKPIPGATSSCIGPRGRQARRAAGRRSRPRTRRAAASRYGSRPTARSIGRSPENLVPTHGDGGNRNDNKYIDNGPTYHQVIGSNSIGVEFAGNYPDVTRRRHGSADRGVEDPRAGAARPLRHSARPGLCPQLDRLQGRALLRGLRAGDAGAAVGRVAGRSTLRRASRPVAGSAHRCPARTFRAVRPASSTRST